MNKQDSAVFGAGCFWCVEAIFQDLKGVTGVQSGYTGGHSPNPDYKSVCSGSTGHAEVIKVDFDPQIISFEVLLEAFWAAHDPTQLNRQGNDIGTQYRSAIFYNSATQKEAAQHSMQAAQAVFNHKIVTEISPLTTFYAAEDYHNNYFNLNGHNPYCSAVIAPKIKKFRNKFAELLKN